MLRAIFAAFCAAPVFWYYIFKDFGKYIKEKGWTRFNYWGLHLFIGKFGGGKTISAVRRAYITAMFRLTSCGVSMILLRWLIPCLIRNTYQMRRSLLTEPEPDSLPILSAIRKRSADLAGRGKRDDFRKNRLSDYLAAA